MIFVCFLSRLLVRQSGKLLHVVPRLHFVDSPEWFGVAADDLFQISATALEETKVLVWHRDKLKLTLMENPYLHTVFEHIVARDVVKKLTQVSSNLWYKNFLYFNSYFRLMMVRVWITWIRKLNAGLPSRPLSNETELSQCSTMTLTNIVSALKRLYYCISNSGLYFQLQRMEI